MASVTHNFIVQLRSEHNRELSVTAVRVASMLHTYADHETGRDAYPGVAALSTAARMKPALVRAALLELRQKGWIRLDVHREKGGHGLADEYALTPFIGRKKGVRLDPLAKEPKRAKKGVSLAPVEGGLSGSRTGSRRTPHVSTPSAPPGRAAPEGVPAPPIDRSFHGSSLARLVRSRKLTDDARAWLTEVAAGIDATGAQCAHPAEVAYLLVKVAQVSPSDDALRSALGDPTGPLPAFLTGLTPRDAEAATEAVKAADPAASLADG